MILNPNIPWASLATKQHQDKWLGRLYHYLASGCDVTELADLSKSDQTWIKSTATGSKIVDDLITYSDVFIDDPHHLRIFVLSDIELQRHLLRVYHDSPVGMHCGRDLPATVYHMIFTGRTCINMSETGFAVALQCIHFKSLQPSHGPMQLRLYQYRYLFTPLM